MNYPSQQEFDDCRSISTEILAEASKSRPDFMDFCFGRVVGKSTIYLDIRPVAGSNCGNLEYFNAGVRPPNSISLEIPCAVSNPADLERVIYGAIIHECTHLLQSTAYGLAYSLTVPIVASTNGSGTSPAAPYDWLYRYYGQPLEQEAHAAQAAAEVEYLIRAKQIRTVFDNAFVKTEVYRRIQSRMPASAGLQVSQWWDGWQNMAYEIYATL